MLDHFTRLPVAWGVFRKEPTADDVCGVLSRGVADFTAPKHLISDRGRQFTSAAYVAWCARHHVRPRWGALGQHGSIAVIERFFRSLKAEYLHHVLYPLRRKSSADPPRRRVRGRLEATVVHLDGVRQLPVVGLRRAA